MSKIDIRVWDMLRKAWADKVYFCFSRDGAPTTLRTYFNRSTGEQAVTPEEGTSSNYRVSRYTGVEDADGKPVYEFDLVVMGGNLHVVRYQRGAFVLEQPGYTTMTVLPDPSLFRVVGNIFESPSALPEGIAYADLGVWEGLIIVSI